jgi:hypothetical protein
MKLQKGHNLFVSNWVYKSSNSQNSGFAYSDWEVKKRGAEPYTLEYPGAYLTCAPASALNSDICDKCLRIYGFGKSGAKGQCDCRGEEV